MYIIGDIAYAGQPKPLLKVYGVRALDDYKLWLRFSTGEVKIFDCKPLLSQPAFQCLQDPAVFATVYIDYGVPVWNDGDIDIAPETLYEKGELIAEAV
ncbi:MAG: DUF2442 domain-containing protein [Ruminococcaceae bacterium]|nr:DUF2442 domain-containing protein [Oscillospiraceae bacterium]